MSDIQVLLKPPGTSVAHLCKKTDFIYRQGMIQNHNVYCRIRHCEERVKQLLTVNRGSVPRNKRQIKNCCLQWEQSPKYTLSRPRHACPKHRNAITYKRKEISQRRQRIYRTTNNPITTRNILSVTFSNTSTNAREPSTTYDGIITDQEKIKYSHRKIYYNVP